MPKNHSYAQRNKFTAIFYGSWDNSRPAERSACHVSYASGERLARIIARMQNEHQSCMRQQNEHNVVTVGRTVIVHP